MAGRSFLHSQPRPLTTVSSLSMRPAKDPAGRFSKRMTHPISATVYSPAISPILAAAVRSTVEVHQPRFISIVQLVVIGLPTTGALYIFPIPMPPCRSSIASSEETQRRPETVEGYYSIPTAPMCGSRTVCSARTPPVMKATRFMSVTMP